MAVGTNPARGIPFYNQLRLALHESLPEKSLSSLPRGYSMVGDIAVLRLKPVLLAHRKKIGAAVLKSMPYARTVALEKSIDGDTRKPNMEIIAGKKDTSTVHREHGCTFKLDLGQVMWCAGNKGEKLRLMGKIGRGEHVVDMFAGIGYFAIPAAKRAARVTAMDINPAAVKMLQENARLNRVAHKMEILRGDCRELAENYGGTADRIIMGWLKNTADFFPAALKIARDGTMIHYHEALPEKQVEARAGELRDMAAARGRGLEVEDIQEVKSISPSKSHLVFDLVVS